MSFAVKNVLDLASPQMIDLTGSKPQDELDAMYTRDTQDTRDKYEGLLLIKVRVEIRKEN